MHDASPSHCTSVAPSKMTVYAIEESKHALLELLDQFTEIELDMAGVTELDTAGLQVLVMLKKTAGAQGKTFRLVHHSQTVIETLTLSGLDAVFADPILIRSPNS